MSEKLPGSVTAIQLTELTKVYNGRRIVDNLSLTMPSGAIFGLLGPNGAGKTTVMKMIAGLTWPTSGVIRIFDMNRADKASKI